MRGRSGADAPSLLPLGEEVVGLGAADTCAYIYVPVPRGGAEGLSPALPLWSCGPVVWYVEEDFD